MNEKTALIGNKDDTDVAAPNGPADVHDRRLKEPIPVHRTIIATVIVTLLLLSPQIWDSTNLPCYEIFGCRQITGRRTTCGPPRPREFQFTDIEPSIKLEYTSCYDDFYCARLEVPLDWNSTKKDSATVNLAIIKLPAKVDVTDPAYGGAVLVNPGGPGGSGVGFLRKYGYELATILDTNIIDGVEQTFANKSRFYDIISWDPRGVGDTTPAIQAYSNKVTLIQEASRSVELHGSLEHADIYSKLFELQGVFGQLLSAPLDSVSDDEHPAQFAGTTSVVRDMVEIIEKHGEWREETAKRVLEYKRKYHYNLTIIDEDATRERTAWTKGKEKLQYWGFSYGTIVGQTFASMYPDRVERLAIDGVVNATDYYSGDWKTELIDSDRITLNFTLECQAAGPKACPFSRLTLNTTESLLDGFDRTISATRDVPLTGLIDKSLVYVSDFMVTVLLFSGYYSGFFGYTVGSEVLWQTTIRNASYFHIPGAEPTCENTKALLVGLGPAQTVIVCSDASNRVNETREEYYEYVKFLRNQSPHFGSALTRITIPCHGFNLEPKWRFDGPFGAVKTANPMLILSQTLDPITPLISAKGAQSLFHGSQVVEAQGIGHTTLGYPSVCAMKEIKKYFYTGKVPQEYTYCAASVRPFQGLDQVVQMTDNLPIEDKYLMAAGLKIAKTFPPDGPIWKYRNEEDAELPGFGEGDWWSGEGGLNDGDEGRMEAVAAQYAG